MDRRELEERIGEHIAPWDAQARGPRSAARIAEEVLRARDAVLTEAGEAPIDRERLEVWLFGRSRQSTPLIGSVYEGLLARVRRGEFDERADR